MTQNHTYNDGTEALERNSNEPEKNKRRIQNFQISLKQLKMIRKKVATQNFYSLTVISFTIENKDSTASEPKNFQKPAPRQHQ